MCKQNSNIWQYFSLLLKIVAVTEVDGHPVVVVVAAVETVVAGTAVTIHTVNMDPTANPWLNPLPTLDTTKSLEGRQLARNCKQQFIY